jgi:hypothetical protein
MARMQKAGVAGMAGMAVCLLGVAACGEDAGAGRVSIRNDFGNPGMTCNSPWTICD